MAEGFGVDGAQTALDALAGAYTWFQNHTAAPGAAGTTAVATEGTRKQCTFGATDGSGQFTTTAQLQWTNVAGTEDFSHLSVWSAVSAGSFGWSGVITANPVVAGDTFSIAAGDFDTSVVLAS